MSKQVCKFILDFENLISTFGNLFANVENLFWTLWNLTPASGFYSENFDILNLFSTFKIVFSGDKTLGCQRKIKNVMCSDTIKNKKTAKVWFEKQDTPFHQNFYGIRYSSWFSGHIRIRSLDLMLVYLSDRQFFGCSGCSKLDSIKTIRQRVARIFLPNCL